MAEAAAAQGPAGAGDAPGRSGAGRARAHLWPGLTVMAILAAVVTVLRLQGRLWWCACGRPDLWWGDARSAHTSQHLFDPYSFTHVLHGVLFCGLLARVVPRLTPAWRFCLAVALEGAW